MEEYKIPALARKMEKYKIPAWARDMEECKIPAWRGAFRPGWRNV
jgi:hypothetical protein